MAGLWRTSLLIIACNLILAQNLALGADDGGKKTDDAADEGKTTGGDEPQPDLPNPLYNYEAKRGSGRLVVKLVTEVSSPASGGPNYNQEEYLDLSDPTRYALVRTNTREVLLSRALTDQIITYRPYTCTVHQGKQVYNNEVDDLSMVLADGSELRLFGMLGIWLDAVERPHSYKYTMNAFIFYEELGRHVFTVKRDDKFKLQLSFSDLGMMPETFEVIDSKRDLVLKKFTVLSFETGLDEIKGDVLKLPVGFDCSRALIEADNSKKPADADQSGRPGDDSDGFLTNYLFTNGYAKFEVSATKLAQDAQQVAAVFTDGVKRLSWMETIYVELAHSAIFADHKSQNFWLLLTKIKSKQQETRTILNHFYNVQYDIDSRKGTCKMSHLKHGAPSDLEQKDGTLEGDEAEDELEDGRLLRFSNGLELPFHRRQLVTMFANPSRTSRVLRQETRSSFDKTKRIEYDISEQAQFEWPYDKPGTRKRFARLIKTFARTFALTGELVDVQLESVTLLLVAPEQDWIMESYHFNLVKRGQFKSWLEVAGAFDISADCYLDDPSKSAGQDYAWTELSYPVSSRQMNLLIENEVFAKAMLYMAYMGSGMWSPFSMPRFELMFTDEALVVRLLLLELPALELVFDSMEGIAIKALEDTSESDSVRHSSPDLRHCSRLCQLHDCYSMTYCPNSRHCVLSRNPVEPNEIRPDLKAANKPAKEREGMFNKEQFTYERVVKRLGCVTYSHADPGRVAALRRQRLAHVLSVLRNQDFSLDAPMMPDELALPRSETGISQQEWNAALADYQRQFGEFNENSNRVAALTWWVSLEGQSVIVMPTAFQVEDDPLQELILRNPSKIQNEKGGGGMLEEVHGDDVRLHDLDQVVQFFEIALNDQCLDMEFYNHPKLATHHVAGQDNSTFVPRLHYLPGLTYDQCALSCLDGERCGVFSYWAASSSCVISNLAQVREAVEMNLVISRQNCVVAQRNYAQHFHKIDNVTPSPAPGRELLVSTPSDCALSCVFNEDFNCFAFDFCLGGPSGQNNCYLLAERRTDNIYRSRLPKGQKSGSTAAANKTTGSVVCNHYERDYLAEFTEIPFHSFRTNIEKLAELTETEGKSSFECADACLNQESDCSAFEFCTQDATSAGGRYKQSCRLARMTGRQQARGAEFEVPEDDPERLSLLDYRTRLSESEWPLKYSEKCHIYALKPNTIQAHLRSLVLGQTMTRHEHQQLQHRLAALSLGFTWAGLFLFLLALATISTALGFGLYWSRERSGLVRHHTDRIQLYLSGLASRFSIRSR